jgi:hypothetical protein
MPKPNYGFEKRQRELEKKRKKAEKADKKATPPSGMPADAGSQGIEGTAGYGSAVLPPPRE